MTDSPKDTGAPIRHVVPWEDPAFTDPAELDAELRRVFDICHGCRRCFNLCDVFPRLFNLIDESESGELDSVDSQDFDLAIEACTLCDMCFMTKCPYVPPHEFDLDFPHLMLRARAVQSISGKVRFMAQQIRKTDRNGKLGTKIPGLANWAVAESNSLTRPVMQATAGIHRRAHLPPFAKQTLEQQAKAEPPVVNASALAHGRKAVLYATCAGNFNHTNIGLAARAVLAKNGVYVEVIYPGCCGMPQLETGDISAVAESARTVATELCAWADHGYDVIALIPSCALMLKYEWPLLVPGNDNVKRLAAATCDVTEYVVGIARNEGLAEGLQSLDGAVALHLACHARAQNMGSKAAEMLGFIPDVDVTVIERCSGHGGAWGIEKDNFEVALKVGKSAAREAKGTNAAWVASECPLAGDHIIQGIDELEPGNSLAAVHPIELLARAYGLDI